MNVWNLKNKTDIYITKQKQDLQIEITSGYRGEREGGRSKIGVGD